jgi:hypothetical protein
LVFITQQPDESYLRTERCTSPTANRGIRVKSKSENAWIESDRREKRKIILTVLVIVGAIAAGIAGLIYGLLHS